MKAIQQVALLVALGYSFKQPNSVSDVRDREGNKPSETRDTANLFLFLSV